MRLQEQEPPRTAAPYALRTLAVPYVATMYAALHRPGTGAERAAGPTPDDVEPVAYETLDRIVTGLVTVVPVLALGLVGWQLWGDRARLERPDRVR